MNKFALLWLPQRPGNILRTGFRYICRLLVGIVPVAELAAGNAAWETIPAEHRNAEPPASAPDAAAEILYARTDLVVKDYKAIQRNFQRIKIYSERAVEELGKLGLEYSESERVSELAVRLVHADGQEIVLPGSQFQETVLGRWEHGRRLAKRLIVPRLVAGDILEMQWRIDEDGRFKGSRFIYCQQTIPVRKFEFIVHNSHSGPMNIATFGAKGATIEGSGSSRGKVVVSNLPAYVEESDMPPSFNVRASILLVYGELPAFENEIWSEAITFFKLYEKVQCSVTAELQKAATELTVGAQFREERLRKLYTFCQEQITNTAFDESAESKAERVVYHEPRTARETWKIKRGNPLEINCLFAALARAGGFETQIAFSADREDILDVKFSHGWYFMKTSGVLVKINGEWQLFAPGDRAVPYGARRWQREETQTIVLEGEFYHWVDAATAYAQQAKRIRQGKLTVDEEGGASGEITETLEGQLAIAWREQHWGNTPSLWEEAVRAEILSLLPEAQITEVRVEHTADIGEPLVFHYALRLANYGALTGDHLVVMPNVFQLHAQLRYTEPTRVNPIRWKYPLQEEVKLDLIFPRDFELEPQDPAQPVADPAGMMHYHVVMEFDAAENCLHYHREQAIGRSGMTTFVPGAFTAMKRLFNELHRLDTLEVVLRKKPAAASTTGQP